MFKWGEYSRNCAILRTNCCTHSKMVDFLIIFFRLCFLPSSHFLAFHIGMLSPLRTTTIDSFSSRFSICLLLTPPFPPFHYASSRRDMIFMGECNIVLCCACCYGVNVIMSVVGKIEKKASVWRRDDEDERGDDRVRNAREKSSTRWRGKGTWLSCVHGSLVRGRVREDM